MKRPQSNDTTQGSRIEIQRLFVPVQTTRAPKEFTGPIKRGDTTKLASGLASDIKIRSAHVWVGEWNDVRILNPFYDAFAHRGGGDL